MNYKYKPGDIILVHGLYGGIFELLTRKITNSSWSHSALVINETEMIEADGTGVRIITIPEYDLDNIGVFQYVKELTEQQKKDLYANAKLMVGLKYDWKQIVGLFFYYVFKKPIGFLFGNKEKAMICSELVDSLYRTIGIDLFVKQPEYVVPGDFARGGKLKRVKL